MKAVIVGTAGHIDHGKSALVRALTGTDPDRLEEEKRRGITIDIGFANLDLKATSGENLRLGFVDVPGHERFVRNMLAGIGGIDLVLLVIAADESVKPQTREHFDICRLLSVQRGITVLTKADLVDAETLEVVRMEVAEYLQGSFLDPATAPIVAVSSKTGEGLDELKRALASLATEAPAKDASAALRLPIDRVFTMKGFGTVITGTLISGSVRKDDELEVHPHSDAKRLRVRGVQVHGAAAEKAIAGQRTALNLAGVEVSELARGMMLTSAGLFRPTKQVSVDLNLLPSGKPLRDRARVHLHAFTAETIAEVSLLESKQLKPGQSGLARLKLDAPLLLLPGDRFIMRQFSPVITIGGGVVLDASEPTRRAKAADRLAFVKAVADSDAGNVLLARVARRGIAGLSLADAVAETGWPPARVQETSTQLQKTGKATLCNGLLITSERFTELRRQALAAVEKFHQQNPLVAGINQEQLREELGVPPEIFHSLLDTLVRDKKLEATGDQVRGAGRGVVLRDDEAESKQSIEQAFAKAGLQVPALKEVLASLRIDQTRAQKIVTLLLRDRVLVKLSDDLVFHRDALEALRQLVVAQKTRTPKLNVVAFKDLTGVTRKYAIPLLEYLDRERVTKRVGDERVIL
jgi:selenocysteine-specific elongation factor